MSTAGYFFFGILGLAILYAIILYNQLVAGRNAFRNAFAQIDVQLQRRHDLIPNLVESCRAFLEHEKQTLQSVTEARQGALNAGRKAARRPEDATAIEQLGIAESVLNRALGQFYAVMEAYPDLKANQTVAQLMEELTSTENRVGFARQAFNDSVMTYHNQREQFPGNIVAGLFGFRPTALFKIDDVGIREPVTVSLR